MKTFSRVLLLCAAVSAITISAYAAGPAVAPWGVDLSYLDKAMAPGADFFAYANGGWLKTAAIPPERSFAGVNLELDKQNEDRLKTIVAELQARKSPPTKSASCAISMTRSPTAPPSKLRASATRGRT